ncbi:putative aldouronate transport system substrate-binding protein [Paenibacillus sp. V4I3]|uniref:extracellular solute-binding protein n=1 Tax=unclassified Paenibacillus TaxID=185978 RepID=UPI00277D5102|nr:MULTISPECIES: extracellular solute-binding protein [unclassified Paenibacillus]MDQ0875560.1 putative aldouronate transport system substrate-binding protein [Paenibacillus sp. V4I3]MDQ0888359.1 putative aldouronate transport system substrate-binding protein [Paenibacillus sp. V4I9]
MKRNSAAILALLTCFATVGCSFPEWSKNQDKVSEAVQEPVIRIVVNSLGMNFPEGMDENNNPYLNYIEKNIGVQVYVTLPPLNGYDEKLNVIMTSGEPPDLLNTSNPSWFINFVNQKALMPLNDYIDKYGAHLKAKIPKEAWDNVTVDGHIYAIPSLNEVKGTEIVYARKDWLDKLGLQPPRTIEEFTAVMKGFAEGDPDGNGIKDTFGLSILERLRRTSPFLGAFGVQMNAWYERDGKLVYSGILPEMKEALIYLNSLYDQNILDPEFPLNKIDVLGEKIATGKVGLYSAAWSDTRTHIAANRNNDPKAVWIPLDFPIGSNGKHGVYSTSNVRSYNVVPIKSQNAEAVVKFLDFIAGPGQTSLKLGFENEIWTRVNGKLSIRFDEHTKHGYRGIYGSLVDTAERDITRDRLEALGEQFHLYENLQRIESNLMEDRFNGPPTPAMGKHHVKLSKLQEETFTRIIAGMSPIEEFDAFVKKWKDAGGDEITGEVNEWWRETGK